MGSFDADMKEAESRYFDPLTLASLASEMGSTIVPLLATLHVELKRRHALLHGAIRSADCVATGRLVHSLKGSALTFGAKALADVTRQADLACRSGNAAETLLAAQKANDVLEKTISHLNELLNSHRLGD